MSILITGGMGYIGSHTCTEMLANGYDVIIADDLSNSKITVLDGIKKITGKAPAFYNADIKDCDSLKKIFSSNRIDAVIHFAGYKSVNESVSDPLSYYENNLISAISLVKVMSEFGCKKLVFSSSSAVYGKSTMPVKEGMPANAVNPYGRTKLFIEEMLKDLYASDNEWSIALLRYFNPVGAHQSGLIGEDPNDIPNNLMPYISQVSVGKLEKLTVYGDDYNTHDGTGIRDYIHVVDLAKGHLKALLWVLDGNGCEEINIGTGKGTSVLELINAFKEATGADIPYVIAKRRPGDVEVMYANTDKAQKLLDFKAQKSITDMCRDQYNFQKKHSKK